MRPIERLALIIGSISSRYGGTLVSPDSESPRTGLADAASKGAIESMTRWIAREGDSAGIL